MALGFLAGLFGGMASTFLSPVQTRTQRASYNLDPVALLNSAAYCDAYRLGVISKKDFYQYMRESGYSTRQAKLQYHTMREWMSGEQASVKRIADSLEDVIQWHNTHPDKEHPVSRLEKIKNEYTRAMYRQGYGQTESAKMFQTLRPVPTFSILLEWLAKEAFEPKIVKRFGLADDYPLIWKSLMKSLGVPDIEAKNYWVAHWNHLSIGQIANVFQRFRDDRDDYSQADLDNAGTTFDEVKMTTDDFKEALKIHEIAPYWHDRYIASSYMPLTLTSLQQGYVYGLEKDSWFLGRLLDYGYSKDNAEFILNVWRRKYPYASKEIMENNILQLQKRGLSTKAEAKQKLIEAEVPEKAAEYLTQQVVDYWDLKSQNEALRQLMKNALTLDNDLPRVGHLIDVMGYDSRITNPYRKIFKSRQIGKQKNLRIRDLVYGYKNGKITENEFRSYLHSLHIAEDLVLEYIKIYKPKTQPETKINPSSSTGTGQDSG